MLRTLRKKKVLDKDLQRTGSKDLKSLEVHGSAAGSTGKQEKPASPDAGKKLDRPASAQRKTRCQEMVEKMKKLVSQDITTDSADVVNGHETKEELPSIVTEVYKMAKVERNHKFMKTDATISTLELIPSATDDNVVKTKAVMALSYLLVDSDSVDDVRKAAEKTNAIRLICNQLVAFKPPEQPEKLEFSEVELLQALLNFAVADENKKTICEEGKDIIPAFLNSEKTEVQSLASELLWNLTFVKSNRPVLRSVKIGDRDIIQLLNAAKTSPNDKIRQNSEGALFVLLDLKLKETSAPEETEELDGGGCSDDDDDDVVIRPSSAKKLSHDTTDVDAKPKEKSVADSPCPPPPPPSHHAPTAFRGPPPTPPPPAPESQTSAGSTSGGKKAKKKKSPPPPLTLDTKKKGHIMLSYNWKNQEVVLKINKRLREEGYHTWIDVENMSGSILEAMAVAVQEAYLVLVCFCKKYQSSPNCRTEGEYVFDLKKEFIPVRMQEFKADNWLGAFLGSHLYVDFSKHHSDNFEEKMVDLLQQVKMRTQRSVPETIPQTETETDSKDDIVADTGKKHNNNTTGITPNTALSRPDSREQEFPTGSSPLPPITSKYGKVTEWTSVQVKEWLTNSQINRYSEDILNQVTGRTLIQLHNLRKEAPEFFYKSLQTDFGMTLLDILKFAQELEKLKL